MSFLTILHVILVGAISFVFASTTVRGRSGGLWLILGYIVGVSVGIMSSFVLAFYLYPSLDLVAQGEDFIFQTYDLFRNAVLGAFVISGLAVVVARMRTHKAI